MITLIIIVAILVFITALIAPRKATKVESKTSTHTKDLEHESQRLWQPLTYIASGLLTLTRRLVKWSSHNGKRTRRKIKSTKDS